MVRKKSEQRKTDPAACQELATGDACASPEGDDVPGWVDILRALEEGRLPDKELLVSYLRDPRFAVDQRIRNYLADHLEGKVKRQKGRPPATHTERIIRRDLIVRVVYGQILAAIRRTSRSRTGTPSARALEETARELARRKIHMSASQVRKIVYAVARSTKRRRCST